RLHHTNIVPVFGVGEHDGIHYYAMQFIQGQGLDSILDELRRVRAAPGPPASRSNATAALAATVAQRLLTGQFPITREADAEPNETLAHGAPADFAPGPPKDQAPARVRPPP